MDSKDEQTSGSVVLARHVVLHDGTPVFYHTDRYTQARNGRDDIAIQGAIAIHMRRGNEELGLLPVLDPFEELASSLNEARSPHTPTV